MSTGKPVDTPMDGNVETRPSRPSSLSLSLGCGNVRLITVDDFKSIVPLTTSPRCDWSSLFVAEALNDTECVNLYWPATGVMKYGCQSCWLGRGFSPSPMLK